MTDLPTPFGTRLAAAMTEFGPFCAGSDPPRSLVEGWGLTYDVAGLERFALTCVEAFAGRVAAVKPQSAFFEVFGSRGVAVLERVLTELREADTLSILDAKRGDIGSTMTAYAEAYLGTEAAAPADSLTAKVTRSPACSSFSRAPSCILNSSVAGLVFAPTVPSGTSLIEMVPLIRSILVTIPVRICWANADEPMMLRAAVAAIIIPAIFMEYSWH